MTNEELISELRRDNSEMQSRIIHLESKIEIANIQIKGLNDSISLERNMMMIGFIFIFMVFLIMTVRIIFDLMNYAAIVEEYKTRTEDFISRKFNEISRSPKTPGD